MPKLENWSVGFADGEFYTPPELRSTQLCGFVFGHPRLEDGKRVRTSRIEAAQGRFVTTHSGTIYELGEPDAEYRAWVREASGKDIDAVNPVTIKEV